MLYILLFNLITTYNLVDVKTYLPCPKNQKILLPLDLQCICEENATTPKIGCAFQIKKPPQIV